MSRFLPTLLLAAAFGASAQPITPTANIDAARESAPISPHIFGPFLERAGDIVYRALWSELIEDREFYYAVMPRSLIVYVISHIDPAGGPAHSVRCNQVPHFHS